MKKKKGNGAAKKSTTTTATHAQTVQQRISTYEQALQQRMVAIEEAKAEVDRLTAEMLQIRGAIGEAREFLAMIAPESGDVILPPQATSTETEASV
jgi:flagellar biosynthesis chaperone FliJ